ncbi:TetR/AcrR family transcriptional regulator [Prosthecomicrobium pneumaticum]|uniref:AcrR family transcriptional regulator n=1 Tax=Prosthecomicrobium pneumaticum TaxID=81895 RepID=A0A7W9FM82_9HYPH|nr:TetR/AcrR family transcriptional regulator [Prosthecomicrobium pneumaticum]MBB5753265.1 AcrR family transcriptional regulator [Prosthecomicrobium pneumaticum]
MAESGGLRARLVQEAIEMVAAGGGEPSLRDLAKRLGVSPMASYRHFPNKAALMEAVTEAGFCRLHARLEEADASGDDDERLLAQGIAYVTFAIDHSSLFRLMFSGHPAEAGDGSARGAAYGVLQRRIAQSLAEAGPHAALACWALVHGLAVLHLDAGMVFDRERVAATLEVFLRRSAERSRRSQEGPCGPDAAPAGAGGP